MQALSYTAILHGQYLGYHNVSNTKVLISGQGQFVQSWTSIYTCLAMRMHNNIHILHD